VAQASAIAGIIDCDPRHRAASAWIKEELNPSALKSFAGGLRGIYGKLGYSDVYRTKYPHRPSPLYQGRSTGCLNSDEDPSLWRDGMVGDGVLRWLIASALVDRVVCISRKPLAVSDPKLEIIVEGDMFHLQHANVLRGFDACLFCLGVSSVGMDAAE
jgi:hypothetical protein